jgi:putative protease
MDRKKQPITVAPGDGHVVYFRCPFPADRAHMGIIVRHFRNGENTRNPVIR